MHCRALQYGKGPIIKLEGPKERIEFGGSGDCDCGANQNIVNFIGFGDMRSTKPSQDPKGAINEGKTVGLKISSFHLVTIYRI